MRGKITDVEIIQSGMPKTAERAARNGMILDVSKSQHIHFRPQFPNQDGTHVVLPQAMATKDLNLIVLNTLKPRAQVETSVAKAKCMLACMQRTFEDLRQISSPTIIKLCPGLTVK